MAGQWKGTGCHFYVRMNLPFALTFSVVTLHVLANGVVVKLLFF